MNKISKIAGISWALACMILIIALFPGLTGFSESLSKAPFMKIHPRYSGGAVEKQIVMPGCTLDIRKPVFKGLISDRNKGFVQLDWRGRIPETINDTIDYNFDGKPDFGIIINTRSNDAGLDRFNNGVKDLLISTPTSYGWAIRVELVK